MPSRISGLYREKKLDLRVDVDGERPLNVVSGDLYSMMDGEPEFTGSFRFKIQKCEEKSESIDIIGSRGEFSAGLKAFDNIKVSIPLSKPEAIVHFRDSFGTSSRTCKYQSEFFKNVLIEHCYEEGVAPLVSYDTQTLSSPSERTNPLSISGAFAEAGIEVTVKKKHTPIPHPKGILGEGSVWTDSELYDAMLKYSAKAKNKLWSLWLLSAQEYVVCTVKGTMLVPGGGARRGCVVFQNATGWETAEEKRLRLFIYMHELGHCFNLGHPWNNPQENSGFSTLSWMNYPWRYRLSGKVYGGEDFWKAFNFQFSDSELMHLRHGFRNDVIFRRNVEPPDT